MKMERSFDGMGERYQFDFSECSYDKGWCQIDTEQDAPYYGNWCNPITLEITTFCEGDITRQQAESVAEFVEAIDGIATWNDENGWKPIRIGPGSDIEMKAKLLGLGLGKYLH